VRLANRIYIRIIFFQLTLFAFSRHVSSHAAIILTKQYSGMDIFSSNHYFAPFFHDYSGMCMLIFVIFIDLQGGLTNDEMQCVIAGEIRGMFSPVKFSK
jgi:hypothetical protein